MTLKIFSAKTHPVLNFLRFTLKKQTPITLLITAFTLLICPGLPLRNMLEHFENKDGVYQLFYTFEYFALLIFCAGILLMLMLLLINFSFLFNKKAGDMYQSLPLTRNQLLFTRTFACFAAAFFTVTVAFAGLGLVNILPGVEGVTFAKFITTYLLAILFLAVSTAFTLIFIVCCGGYFDTFIALGSINLGPLALMAVFINLAFDSVTGVAVSDELLFYSSPYIFMAGKLFRQATYYDLYAVPSRVTVLEIIGLVLFGVICIIAASKLFSIRKSETAGEAYGFKFVPLIISMPISAVGGYLVGYIMSGNTSFSSLEFWVFFIIGAILCSITYGVITARGFKTLKKSVISGGVAVVLMISLVIGSTVVASRAEVYVPREKEIKKIYVDSMLEDDIVYEEDFNIVLDIHSQVVENIKNKKTGNSYKDNAFINSIHGINITYVLKNEKRVERRYWYGYCLDNENTWDALLKLVQSDNYLDCYDKSFKSQNQFVGVTYLQYGEDSQNKKAVLTNQQAKTLLELYKKEMKKSTKDIFSESCYEIEVGGDTYSNLFIPYSFEECWGYLEPMLTLSE